MRNPELVLVSAKQTATTYSFQTTGEGFKGFRSWALCTVNDATGELHIQSDWGTWSHRWNAGPQALGRPTLTAFIGEGDDVDYLARKLQNEGRNCRRWSGEATARVLQQKLCERRLEDGREQLHYRLDPEDMPDGHRYTDDGLPIFGHRGSVRDPLPYLDKETARRIYDNVSLMGSELDRNAALFYERLYSIEGFLEYVTAEPWHYDVSVQTPEDEVLRDLILPALIQACKAAAPPPDPVREIVAYLRRHADTFDDAVADEERDGGTLYAHVKQRTTRVLAARIEVGDWRKP